MRYNVVLRYIGIVMLLCTAFMLLSAGISLFNGMDTGFYPLLLSAVLTAALGGFPMIFVGKSDNIGTKEAYAIVVGAWLVACFVGAFPYLLWGGEFDMTAAWFESVSGFTATGVTALNDVEALPKGLLFWRSSTSWLGGIGVVMFVLIILPSFGRTKMTLSSIELSHLARENYRYKSTKIVQILLVLYVGLTLTEAVLLRLAGMGWFDAVNHALSTIATGGFSTRNTSIAYFDNVWIETIIALFMALSGIHFGLLFATITGRKKNIFRSETTRFYIITFLVAGVLIALSLWRSGSYDSGWQALRHGMFHSISYITTTGFATADTAQWTPFAILILTLLLFQCGCSGSTSGGIKSDRVWLAMKVLKARILQQQHPNAIIRVKLNNIVQDESMINSVLLFIVVYMMIVLAGSIVVSATGLDVMTSFSMVAACMGNIGSGFGEVGSMGNYAAISMPVKFLCTLFMLLGRLEIFGLIQLFMFKRWK